VLHSPVLAESQLADACLTLGGSPSPPAALDVGAAGSGALRAVGQAGANWADGVKVLRSGRGSCRSASTLRGPGERTAALVGRAGLLARRERDARQTRQAGRFATRGPSLPIATYSERTDLAVLPPLENGASSGRSPLGRRSAERSLPVCGSRSDEQLVALVREGQHSAFDVLVARYQPRLLWFCWRILRSKEDAEDALQDVFVAAFNAIVADGREIHVRPWLYRIARNRCVDQLRRSRTASVGDDWMDEHCAESGRCLVENVVTRQEFRELVSDVQALPGRQRTALLLREIDGFSYRQIALAMRTTVPSVKSLLVRARTGLLAAAVARDTTPPLARPEPTPGRVRVRARENARAISYPAARAAANAA
jgi:RNA polymerase sigma factor (sigma-70 family)